MISELAIDTSLASILRREVIDWPCDAEALDEHQFVERAILHGVAPLVARRLAEQPPNGWPASIDQQLRRIEAETAALAVLREREFPRVLEQLARSNIHPVIIKGAALGQT